MTRRQFNWLGGIFGAIIGFFATAGAWEIASAVGASRQMESSRPPVIQVMESLKLHVDPAPVTTVEPLPYAGPTIEPEPMPPRKPRPARKPPAEPPVVYGPNGAPVLD
jgi:hypothetical protein